MTFEKAGLLEEEPVPVLNRPFAMRANSAGPPSPAIAPARDPFVEKRREARYETCDAVEVCILEPESPPQPGVLRDVSRSGLRIELNLPVEAGARLEVFLMNRAIIFGEARYCRRSAQNYQVGMVIDDIYYPAGDPASSHDERRRGSTTLPWFDRGLPDKCRAAAAPTLGRTHARGVFSQRLFVGGSTWHRLSGCHVSLECAAAFVRDELSETKTALVERHLTLCEECSTLMWMVLEDHTSFVQRFGNDTDNVQSGFGRVKLSDPEAPKLIRESAAVLIERSAAPEKTKLIQHDQKTRQQEL